MLGRLALLILVAVASPIARAGQATLGNVSINLPPPAGFCELSDSDPSDQRMLSVMSELVAKSGNKLLNISADCGQLSAWHTGTRRLLDDYAGYQTPVATIDKPPSETIQQTCAFLRAEGNKVLSNQLPDLKARIEAALKQVKVNQTSFIGVLAEDRNACYAGLIQQLHTEAGTEKTQVSLFAATIVKNRSVFVYRFAEHTGPDSVSNALANLKDDVAALYAANE